MGQAHELMVMSQIYDLMLMRHVLECSGGMEPKDLAGNRNN